MTGGSDPSVVLRAEGLTIRLKNGPTLVNGIDLDLASGSMTCLVGESGSGKSLTALALMGLLQSNLDMTAASLTFEGRDMMADRKGIEKLRGDRLAMVFQEPMTALNPVMNIGDQVAEVLVRHRQLSAADAREQVLRMFREVQIPAPEARFDAYPHQLSGGLRQRVMIAMALICRPSLLIADEPTTALDVTIQNQVITLLDDLRSKLGTAVLMITHNLALVSEIADRIHVMYAGQVVEVGTREQIFRSPQHPYTLALFAAMPRTADRGQRLAAIEGQVPAPGQHGPGCRFAPRCPFAGDRCRTEAPRLSNLGEGHRAACWHAPIERHFRRQDEGAAS